MTDETKEMLKLFRVNAGQLRSHSLLRSKELKIKTSVTMNGSQIVIHRHTINEETLESFLLRLRRFSNKRDDLFLPKIIKVISRHERTVDMQDKLNDVRDQFFCRRAYCGIKCKHNGKAYSESDIFDLFINGRLFHVDRAKESVLAEITDPSLFEFDMFLGAVINKANAVLKTEAIIEDKAMIS